MQSTSDNLCVYQGQKVISEIGGLTNYGREELKNFNDYCNERWGMGRHQAYNLIRGSQGTTNLLAAVNILHPCEIQPIHEKQVRPFRILELAQHCDVWEEAVRSADGKVVNYKQVKALVAELMWPWPFATTPKKGRRPGTFFRLRQRGFPGGRQTDRRSPCGEMVCEDIAVESRDRVMRI